MTVDLLVPISRHIAQIAENAFEEEQPEYAIESLKIAFQMGMYPTRDLFLATLAVIVSSPDLKERATIAQQKKKEAEKTKRYNKFLFKDIEKQTIISAIELVNDLVQACPNVIGRYLPPFHRAYDDKGKVIDKEGSNAESIEWQKEQRNWLRRSANSEGPSSPEDSRANSRNRSPAVVRNPFIALPLQMLECNDVFTLLALNPAEIEDATKGIQRIGRNKRGQMSRDGDDDEEAADAREVYLRDKYDRPGTWILLSILCSFWDLDLNLSKKAGRRGSIFNRTPHLSKQVAGRDWKVPLASRPTRGNAAFNNNVLGEAMDLIKVGLLPNVEHASLKKEKNARDSKSLAACNLLRLFESMATLEMIDRQALMRAMTSVMERIDAFTFEKLANANLLVNETTFFARSAIQHLSHWQEEDASSPWDAETKDLLSDCKEENVWDHQQKEFLHFFGKGLWLLHRTDWTAEEEIQFWRLTKSSTDKQPDAINGFLMQDTWQLHPSKTRGHPKKRISSKTDRTQETENRMQSFTIASEIRRRAVDRMVTHIQLQQAILECLHQSFVKLHPDRANLNQIWAKAVTILAQNIESNSKMVEKCLKGMQDTYKQILEGDILQGENSDQGESRKRRRTADNDEEEPLAATVSPEKSLQFVVRWTQVEEKIERYLSILEAAAFSIKSPSMDRKRDSSSSDLTDLSED